MLVPLLPPAGVGDWWRAGFFFSPTKRPNNETNKLERGKRSRDEYKNVHVAAATPHSLSYGRTMEINELVVITGQVRQSLIAGHLGLEGRK